MESITLSSLDYFFAPTPSALNSHLEVWEKGKAGEKEWQEDREGKAQFYISYQARQEAASAPDRMSHSICSPILPQPGHKPW